MARQPGSHQEAEALLAEIERGVVGMLETILGGSADAPVAEQAQALGALASYHGLDGFAAICTLLCEELCSPGAVDHGPGPELVEVAVSGLLNLAGADFDAAAARLWVEKLMPASADEAGVRLVRHDRLVEQLAADAERFGQWRSAAALAPPASGIQPDGGADGQSDFPPARERKEIAADEMALLAEACAELDQKLRASLATWCAPQDDPPAQALVEPDAAHELLEELAERFEEFALALGVLDLGASADLLTHSATVLRACAADPDSVAMPVRCAIRELPARWQEVFKQPGSASLDALFECQRRAGFSDVSMDAAARAQWANLHMVASRRIASYAGTEAAPELDLDPARDLDPQVRAQLLLELPMLSETFSQSIEGLLAGDPGMSRQARRAAHTLKGAAGTAGIDGIARFTHALEDLLLLSERPDGPHGPWLQALLGEAADTLGQMVDAVAQRSAAPASMMPVYRAMLARLAGEPEVTRRPPGPSTTPAGDTPATMPLAQAGGADSVDARAILQVPGELVDRLVDLSTEAVVVLTQIRERLDGLDSVARALRRRARDAQDLALDAQALTSTLRTSSAPAFAARGNAVDSFVAQGGASAEPLEALEALAGRLSAAGVDARRLEAEFAGQLEAVAELAACLDRAQTGVRATAVRARMIPVADIERRLVRAARQAARAAGKSVRLQLIGREELLEAHLLQTLVEPLGHLIRNAVDHGIERAELRAAAGKPETGQIEILFEHLGSRLLRIVCSDDGQGLDLERIRARGAALGVGARDWDDPAELARVICAPELSTRDRASQLSGRGLGLALVAGLVAGQRGRLEAWTRPSEGLRLALTLPLELASVAVLPLRCQNFSLGLLAEAIEAITAVGALHTRADGSCTMDGGARGSLRVARLHELLGLPSLPAMPPGKPVAEVALVLAQRCGTVDAILTRAPDASRQVLVHPLPGFMPAIPGLEGAGILGDGAVVPVVDLRALGQPAQAGVASTQLPAHIRQPRCLVVDDSPSQRQAMAVVAGDLGLAVDLASDGREALALLPGATPSIALLDLEMPYMDGLELTRALRARKETAAIPVIMISSRDDREHRARAALAGVSHFVAKPFCEEQLAQLIRTSLLQA